MNHLITLADLVVGLSEWSDRYEALDVFADDVAEMRARPPLRGLKFIGTSPPRWEVRHGGTTYHVILFEEAGVLRLERPRASLATRAARTGVAGAAGAAIGATLEKAAEQKGSAAKLGLLLGLVIGAVAEGVAASKPRRAFTLRFDPVKRSWLAYDGGLMNWMREKLLPA